MRPAQSGAKSKPVRPNLYYKLIQYLCQNYEYIDYNYDILHIDTIIIIITIKSLTRIIAQEKIILNPPELQIFIISKWSLQE